MSTSKKGYEKPYKFFAEDEGSSDAENDPNIPESTAKSLNLSQYMDALSHSKENLAQDGSDTEAITTSDSEDDLPPQKARPPPSNLSKNQGAHKAQLDGAGNSEEEVQATESEWSEEDPEADYIAFKNRNSVKRKRVAEETKRIRAVKRSRSTAANSIIGRKPGRKDLARSTNDPDGDTYLDDPTPEYIEARKRKLKKLHEAGLRYPPCYDDIEFSDTNSEERPVLHPAIKTQRVKKDIKLPTGAIIPARIAQWLRDYQIDGVQFLHERFVRQSGALLGDDMGLGKTIQVIAFLTAAFGKTAQRCDAKRMRKIRRLRDRGDRRWYPRILIVCPGTLMQNWEDELAKWGWWQVYRYHGSPSDKSDALDAAKQGMTEIMITTYTTYRNMEGEINTVDWDCVIADECHQIKSRAAAITKSMNRVNALCRIGLTGTAIQNKYEELWNLLNWARPGDYGSAQEWKQFVSIPLKIGQAHDASNSELATARAKAKDLVEKILPDVFLRRMKTLIADQLPKKSDRVVFCQLTDTQADAYRSYIESDRCEYIRTAKEPCDCNSGKNRGWCCYQELPEEGEKWSNYMFPSMVTLQKIANHVALLLPRTADPRDKQAKDLENLQLACPEDWDDLYRIRDNIFDHSQRDLCGKWKVLKRLLDFWRANGDKVLVFSHSVRLLRLLKTLFDVDGTKYNMSYLDGSMSYDDRSKAVADFNSNPSQFVFLISTKAGGVGLNITSANKVVVADPNWNPAYDLQAQDRAYRIGQTRDVEVFRLVSSGTIEEIVYARQIYKQQQANIGYTASDERRYFRGVMDDTGKAGELFGLENLFAFEQEGYILRDIVHKTNVAETRAGVSAVDVKLDSDNELDSDEEDDLFSNKSLGITEDEKEDSQMRKFAEIFINDPYSKTKKKFGKRSASNPINAILAKAGVQYTHENSEVIGRSRIEAELGRRAMEVRNDLEMGRKQVFAFSQTHNQALSGAEYSGEEGEDEDRVSMLRSTPGTEDKRKGKEEFKINYKYRPNESVRRRQFCSMAKIMGYEDPVEFALVVEEMTQEERRRMLEKFYRNRRRQISVEFGRK